MSRREYSLEDLQQAIQVIDSDDRETWVRTALALKCTFGEDAFAIWDDWSAQSGKYDQKIARMVWKSGKAGKLTAGTVFKQARERGWSPDAPAVETEHRRREREQRAARRAEQLAAEAIETAQYQDLVAAHSAEIWGVLHKVGTSKYLGEKGVPSFGLGFATEQMISVIHKDKVAAEIITGREAISDFLKKANDIQRDLRPFSYRYLKRGCFAVPMRDMEGRLWGLQIIWPTGSKTFFYGGRKSGCFHLTHPVSPDKPLAIAEGYATGATINVAAKWPVAIAFDAGNLLPVATALRQAHPDQSIVICADNDEETAGNPGVTAAASAAHAVGAYLAVPAFSLAGASAA